MNNNNIISQADKKSYFETSKMIDTMIQTINKMINRKLRDFKVDITKIGMISEIDKNDEYKFKVEFDGQKYTVKSATDQKYELGDRVLILIIGGNYNNKYIIGRAR